MITVLYFDKSGFALWQKRLERDKFPWPKDLAAPTVRLTPEQFAWLLEGYDVWNMKSSEELHFDRVC
ncbi:MAG: transposase [Bdellovibrionaceae bacterium]|nr:transposase [Pseudobdellovibrionaceae bacterium]